MKIHPGRHAKKNTEKQTFPRKSHKKTRIYKHNSVPIEDPELIEGFILSLSKDN